MSEGQVALVTGGARRIGRDIVLRLAEANYAVVIHCNTSREDADALAGEIKASGGRADVVAANLSEGSAVDSVIPRAMAMFGPLTLLVNNASLFLKDGASTFTLDGLHANMAVNLEAPLRLAQAFAAQAKAGSDPSIVNLIDQRVFRLTPQFFSYTLAKSALWTATRTLAQALAPRIRVNGVGPGPTLANIHDGIEGFEQEARNVPLGRGVDPREISDAVLYLARARSVTGQMLAVDGGQHLAWRTPDIVE